MGFFRNSTRGEELVELANKSIQSNYFKISMQKSHLDQLDKKIVKDLFRLDYIQSICDVEWIKNRVCHPDFIESVICRSKELSYLNQRKIPEQYRDECEGYKLDYVFIYNATEGIDHKVDQIMREDFGEIKISRYNDLETYNEACEIIALGMELHGNHYLIDREYERQHDIGEVTEI